MAVATADNNFPYEHQKVYFVNVNNYIYKVPYVEDEEKIFLKTAFPSREATKLLVEYLEQNEKD